jgi:hypothetical protein
MLSRRWNWLILLVLGVVSLGLGLLGLAEAAGSAPAPESVIFLVVGALFLGGAVWLWTQRER